MIRMLAFIFVTSAAISYLALPATAQMFEHPVRDNSKARVSPNARVDQTIGTNVFSISFSRPSVNGRTVFGGLEPFGKVWRSGANEATSVVIPVDVEVEGQPLPAGVYSFVTVPGESEWTVTFNSQAKQWGAFKHDSSLDVLSVKVQSHEAPHQEMLAYSFEDVTEDSATVVMHWGTTAVPFRIKIAG